MTLTNKGKRQFSFNNGDKIDVNFGKETYSGAFIGSLRSEAIDGFKCQDEKNKIKCEIKFGKVKKRYLILYIDHLTT